MFVLTTSKNLVVPGESTVFMTEEDLNFIFSDDKRRILLLEGLEEVAVAVSPISESNNETTFVKSVNEVKSHKLKWGCSHSVG